MIESCDGCCYPLPYTTTVWIETEGGDIDHFHLTDPNDLDILIPSYLGALDRIHIAHH